MYKSKFFSVFVIYTLSFLSKIFALDSSIIKSLNSIDFSEITYIAPASWLSSDQWIKINKILSINKKINVKAMHNNSIPYHAADDTTRFNSLLSALNGDAKYLWCIRGGYGSARLLDDLQLIKKPKRQKILIGYSDITFLHLFFNKWGWKTIHASMPSDLANEKINPKNFSLLAKILSYPKGKLSYQGLKPMNELAKNSKLTTGEILGGNLTLLENSLGTSWQIDGKNKIILIEDIGSDEYAIDRSLLHMQQAGVFSSAKAILFGKFIPKNNNNIDLTYAIQRFAKLIKIPVFFSADFGHSSNNYPLPFGFTSTISENPNKKDFILNIPYDFSE